MMAKLFVLAIVIVFLWGGLSLGGALIVAPAKFQAPNVSRLTALQVGKIQFAWLHRAEKLLLLSLFLCVFLANKNHFSINKYWFYLPVIIFLIQIYKVQPVMHERTVSIINGGDVFASSKAHVVFIVLEVSKFLSLLGVGIYGLLQVVETQ